MPQLQLEFEPKTYTVSELTAYLARTLKMDPVLGGKVMVEGEVSNLKRSSRGHVYFTLKDGSAAMNGVMWASTASKSKFALEEGMAVICTGELDIYAPSGTYSLVVRKLEPVGVGALQLAFQQLKERFEAEGLFAASRKRPLPEFPFKIGIVTAQTGAVIHDMMRVIRSKNPFVEVVLAPVKVQGEGAAEEIATAIAALNEPSLGLEALIVARGGGSFEDLFCFSEEPVVRAIAESRLSVVAGVGHEPDFGLADAVADASAATPTMAAETLVPDGYRMVEVLQDSGAWMAEQLERQLLLAEENLAQLADRLLERVSPRLNEAQQSRNLQREAVLEAMQSTLDSHTKALEASEAELEAYNPTQILRRGYSILTLAETGEPVVSVEALQETPALNIKLQDGALQTQTYEITKRV